MFWSSIFAQCTSMYSGNWSFWYNGAGANAFNAMSALPSVVMCPPGSFVTSISIAFANWGNSQGYWMNKVQMVCDNGMDYTLLSSAAQQANAAVQSSTGEPSTLIPRGMGLSD